jgi:hypothetical protein
LRSEIGVAEERARRRLYELGAEPCLDDRSDSVSAVCQQAAVIMTFVSAALRVHLERRSLGLPPSVRSVMIGGMPVHQLSVLGAAAVLDEQHVTAGRGLQDEPQQRSEDANPPNHGGSG